MTPSDTNNAPPREMYRAPGLAIAKSMICSRLRRASVMFSSGHQVPSPPGSAAAMI